eukprot:1761932-Prymnesium_polylepis.1
MLNLHHHAHDRIQPGLLSLPVGGALADQAIHAHASARATLTPAVRIRRGPRPGTPLSRAQLRNLAVPAVETVDHLHAAVDHLAEDSEAARVQPPVVAVVDEDVRREPLRAVLLRRAVRVGRHRVHREGDRPPHVALCGAAPRVVARLPVVPARVHRGLAAIAKLDDERLRRVDVVDAVEGRALE